MIFNNMIIINIFSILNNYRNKVILLVNTASRCGFTPQYEFLQSLYKKYQSIFIFLIPMGFKSYSL